MSAVRSRLDEKDKIFVCRLSSHRYLGQTSRAKLRLAIDHSNHTISASPGAGTCSIESLKGSLGYKSSIHRSRFDRVASTVYAALKILLSLCCLSCRRYPRGLRDCLCLSGLDERYLLRGWAERFGRSLRGESRDSYDGVPLFEPTAKKIDGEPWGIWAPVVQEPALPVRRTVPLDIALAEESKRFTLEVFEVKDAIQVEHVQPHKSEVDNEEEEEEIEIKHKAP